ncbi:entericidin A/B family lipoprotein [Collimonas sp.]|jgi:entericidin B|nr:entericidin A/B family lipoprotein [Collimonas sp.]HWW99888.1 entericidin A/B family lipoprotein [Collimonas sp.]
MIKKVMVIAAMFGMFGAISACNTVSGMGKDVQTGGEKVQDAAQDVQKKM